MTDYIRLADAIRATLLADAWTGNSANVKTIEAHKRGYSLQDPNDLLSFADAELPALTVIANARPKEQSQETTNEIRERVRSQVLGVSRHRDAQAGLAAHLLIVENVERILEAQKSSSADLGIDAFVQTTFTTQEQFKRGPFYYFVSTTDAVIELTRTF